MTRWQVEAMIIRAFYGEDFSYPTTPIRPIYLISIEFSKTKRQIVGFYTERH
jgi:hypothetical protein